jgi:hypothetical protein
MQGCIDTPHTTPLLPPSSLTLHLPCLTKSTAQYVLSQTFLKSSSSALLILDLHISSSMQSPTIVRWAAFSLSKSEPHYGPITLRRQSCSANIRQPTLFSPSHTHHDPCTSESTPQNAQGHAHHNNPLPPPFPPPPRPTHPPPNHLSEYHTSRPPPRARAPYNLTS